jgi:hypothetical protein
MATATETNGADAILAHYAVQAAPKLMRLGEIAETVMGILRNPPRANLGAEWPDLTNTPIENRVGYLSSMVRERAPGIVKERGELDREIRDLENEASLALDRWLATQRTEAGEARVIDPGAGTSARQSRRISMAIQASDLSRLPTDHLVSTGQQALARGDMQDAEIRLMAARLRGEPNRNGLVNDLAAALDEVLDATLPHRRAAVHELDEGHRAYGRAKSEILLTGQLLARLSRDPAPSPDTGSGGVGSTPAEHAAAKSESHEWVLRKVSDWMERHAEADVLV